MFEVRQPAATEEQLEAENQAAMQSMQQQGLTPDMQPMPMERRSPFIPPKEGEAEPSAKIDLFKGQPLTGNDRNATEEEKARHTVLVATLDEEAERQAEERQQAQIDDDYYHHLQWTAEQARVLINRGQAPLVFNESRASIDWLCGTERRLRKDYKIRPRERNDEATAESKTKVFKYCDDVNLAPWHRSYAAKQMFTSGLGWLEEGINLDPDRELIYAGSEDWRRVYRDSRGRALDQADWRYLHRRKILDLDYGCALFPRSSRHLQSIAGRWGSQDDEADDVWYLGQRLTNANTMQWAGGNDGLFGGDYTVRAAGTGYDHGRRNSVEVIETFYRVPETVRVFAAGPQHRKVYNPADPRHMQLSRDKWPMYETVKWRMRIMLSTKYEPMWDGVSPFSHGRFLLVPMFGYRRGRDGLMYGAMRGMRDPQDDLNKRKSKALFALSVNRITMKDGAANDIEEVREEAARADGVVVVNDLNNIRYEKFLGEVQMNMEMAEADRQHIRNAGGVTGDNLGQESSAISGKAIIAKQEQGSLTSYELFDNFFLAFKLCGQLRMSHIEQFCNQQWTIRIDPQGNKPAEWITVNEFDDRTGQYKNDITASQADFIVDQQDYRATITQSAMEGMFDLLSKLAVFAPQVVLALLDLAVDSGDVPNKEEWVSRIRKLTGQRDPSKAPTPEEIAADQANQQKQQRMEEVTIETAEAKLGEIKAKITNMNADKVMKNLTALLSSMEAAAVAVTAPGIVPVADSLASDAGFIPAGTEGLQPVTPQITQPALPAPNPAPGAGFPPAPGM
jgi:hypothetical protein